ncbi:TRAP transporter solute receptor, TAXI family protein [Plesiocystis pacifica SIR-1]|uniref:TRAP transporter solute receptor, TAXI family protein n=1 Tax=Plesiocystis pacifica SIR-1 TaxID=391625 RepID=A6FYR9_9BACT|nr:TAXI family TRAP transporter solute-binding subunit [Plesiocystis pacifica]EDM81341.1 TRAP transporter solute receptor, TAXI family protein [Plesiocystis pacifica SIR-1]
MIARLRLLPALAVLLVALLLAAPARAGEPLRFGAGSESGRFTTTARALDAELDGTLELDVQTTAGSCDNVRKLARGELDAALVKYDVAAEAFAAARTLEARGDEAETSAQASGWMCGLRPEELAGVELQLIAAVEESAAHLLLRRPVRLDALTSLGERPIFVGQHGSGSMETSKILLGAAGLSLDDVNALDMKNGAAMTAMAEGELLLLLRTTKVGTRSVEALLGTGMAALNPLPDSVIERLSDGFPYYRVCTIPARSYPGQSADVATVCVSTVVLTARRKGADALTTADALTLIEGLEGLEKAGEVGPLRWQDFAERTPVPLHPGAEQRDIEARAREPGTIRFGGSSEAGAFTVTARAIAEALDHVDADFRLDVRTTGGSCDNVRKLARGELDAALVQYAVAAEAYTPPTRPRARGSSRRREPRQRVDVWAHASELAGVELQLIAAIDDAAAHLIVHRPVRLEDFSALGEHPVFLGQRGSGSMETSKVILGAAGLTLDDVNALDISNASSMAVMRRGELLVMLRTTKVGSRKIEGLLATGSAGLNALPDSIIERLIDGFPYYRVCQIDANAYPGQNFGVPTVCVSTVVLTARRPPESGGEAVDALSSEQAGQLIDGLRWLEQHPSERVAIDVRFRGFAEREPVPLHAGAQWAERRGYLIEWSLIAVGLALALGLGAMLRSYLRRRGLIGNQLSGNLEGQLSNPLVPFVGFLLIVGLATLAVWNIEHDSNARVRTLNDSFWEMNMFATGNFDSESLKTSQARVIGVAATVAGLGLLAWFTAALTSILSRDQMRLFRRTRNHIVILNFREEMLQLIRVLRSPGPRRQRSIHVVISEALPARVRAQLRRVRGLTLYELNPEVPEDLVELRLPRAARVLVLQGSYHPLRVARAVHHACVRLDPQARTETMKRAQLGLAPSVQSPTIAGDAVEGGAQVPVTLVEAGDDDADGLYDPFERWLMPVPAREHADAWLANACLDPQFGDVFNDIVTFRDEHSELYTLPLPASVHGKTWRELRRLLFSAKSRSGIVPIGLYHAHGGGAGQAYAAADLDGSSPQAELSRRLSVNPPLSQRLDAGDRLLAFAEDEAELRKVLQGL